MIINQNASEQLAQRTLYLLPKIEIMGRGFLGKQLYCHASMSFMAASEAYMQDANIGCFFGGTCGFFNKLSLGNYCSVAEGVKVLKTYAEDRLTTSFCSVGLASQSPIFANFKGTSPFDSFAPTIVGHDVWIGSNALLQNGICIGHGAIVGSGAVVTKNVPPFAIVGGSPAKIIRMRFSDTEIERILKSAWYTYDWSNIEVDWGDRHNCIAQMEDLIASNQVPVLNEGLSYEASQKDIKLKVDTWTLEQQLQQTFKVSSMEELFATHSIQENMLN